MTAEGDILNASGEHNLNEMKKLWVIICDKQGANSEPEEELVHACKDWSENAQ